MGTRADFYIGTGPDAEWLGSVAWDGHEWGAGKSRCQLRKAKTPDEFRAAVEGIRKSRDDFTSRAQGWPWPWAWATSATTDFVYWLDGDKVRYACFDKVREWPDMTARTKVTFGKRSGIIVFGRP